MSPHKGRGVSRIFLGKVFRIMTLFWYHWYLFILDSIGFSKNGGGAWSLSLNMPLTQGPCRNIFCTFQGNPSGPTKREIIADLNKILDPLVSNLLQKFYYTSFWRISDMKFALFPWRWWHSTKLYDYFFETWATFL